MNDTKDATALAAEAKAFDRQIEERIKAGHLPDLRGVTPCDWFYNNPWRRPYLVDKVFGRYFRFARRWALGAHLLEVGSGPGHMALEFAREGFHVMGVELSPTCVDIARKTAFDSNQDPGFGTLEYDIADFNEWQPPHLFDTVTIFMALHHFQNPGMILDRCLDVLKPSGRLIVVEPARDQLNLRDAAIIALIRTLLSTSGHWHKPMKPPTSKMDWEDYVKEIYNEFREAHDHDTFPQSPNDNACMGDEMIRELRTRFIELCFENGFAFFPQMGGGVRADNEDTAELLARSLEIFDRYTVDNGILSPGTFLWAGEKKIADE